MDTATQNQIDYLLKTSGLFPEIEKPSRTILEFDFKNETILITGAAGSIGSELAKQISKYSFKNLILIDIAESPLHDLINEPEFENRTNVNFLILNITQKESLEHLFLTLKPTVIFHAAAYKHVPLMELNPFESIKVNILATQILADLSVINGVKKFIYISTDKAVNPISIMGISKRIAEDYLLSLSTSKSTIFIATRFGNIFGSNGSVVPLFKKRIEIGEPVIITHKAISRYFINKEKACELILKISQNKYQENTLLTFNMGNSIKIIDLVERLTLFCNKKQVDLKFTTLRPGEKLHEDLVSENEILIPSEDKDILIVQKKTQSIFPINYLKRISEIKAFTPNKEVKALLDSYFKN